MGGGGSTDKTVPMNQAISDCTEYRGLSVCPPGKLCIAWDQSAQGLDRTDAWKTADSACDGGLAGNNHRCFRGNQTYYYGLHYAAGNSSHFGITTPATHYEVVGRKANRPEFCPPIGSVAAESAVAPTNATTNPTTNMMGDSGGWDWSMLQTKPQCASCQYDIAKLLSPEKDGLGEDGIDRTWAVLKGDQWPGLDIDDSAKNLALSFYRTPVTTECSEPPAPYWTVESRAAYGSRCLPIVSTGRARALAKEIRSAYPNDTDAIVQKWCGDNPSDPRCGCLLHKDPNNVWQKVHDRALAGGKSWVFPDPCWYAPCRYEENFYMTKASSDGCPAGSMPTCLQIIDAMDATVIDSDIKQYMNCEGPDSADEVRRGHSAITRDIDVPALASKILAPTGAALMVAGALLALWAVNNSQPKNTK